MQCLQNCSQPAPVLLSQSSSGVHLCKRFFMEKCILKTLKTDKLQE